MSAVPRHVLAVLCCALLRCVVLSNSLDEAMTPCTKQPKIQTALLSPATVPSIAACHADTGADTCDYANSLKRVAGEALHNVAWLSPGLTETSFGQ